MNRFTSHLNNVRDRVFSIHYRPDAKPEFLPVGTGFIVGEWKNHLIGITANHVLHEIKDRVLPPDPPNVVRQFAARKYMSPKLCADHIYAMIASDQPETYQVCPVGIWNGGLGWDVAAMLIRPPKGGWRHKPRTFRIDSSFPRAGTAVAMVGCVREFNRGEGTVLDIDNRLDFRRSTDIRVGMIQEVFIDGRGLVTGGGISTNIPTEHGMSGGPVVVVSTLDDLEPVVVAVTSTEFGEPDVAPENRRSGSTVASLISHALSVRFPIQVGRNIAWLFVIQLVAEGSIHDVAAGHKHWELRNPGDEMYMVWNREPREPAER